MNLHTFVYPCRVTRCSILIKQLFTGLTSLELAKSWVHLALFRFNAFLGCNMLTYQNTQIHINILYSLNPIYMLFVMLRLHARLHTCYLSLT
ncbi:hypothetical protein HanIR_Chr08g0389831 [Helianthus annuus]|nr:hypothetical protein HanIR_Chr08g0389831 [Helianthus annuus]